MSVLRINKLILPRHVNCKSFASLATKEEEYTATPQYPQILDLSFDKVLERKKQSKHEEIKAVKTVEEKQIKLNMPKFYGFKSYLLREENIPYNNLNLAQHVTRTHLSQNEILPEYYNKINSEENVLNAIRNEIEELLLIELEGFRRIHDLKKHELEKEEEDNLISGIISKNINRILLNNLSRDYPHLASIQVDLDSRIESYWNAGGMVPPVNVKKYREGTPWQKHRIDEPTDRVMCYLGTANVALRSNKPLLPIIPYSEAEDPALEVPYYKYDPRTVGIHTEHRHQANVPGFWAGDPNQFGLVSLHKRGHLLRRNYNDEGDQKEAVHRQAILSSFAWLNAQANFLGFTTFNDITYPLVTQTILTNGQNWSFYVYQMNTMALFGKNYLENPKRNICWSVPELKLFEEIQQGKLIGFNDEVLKLLTKFYSNTPETRLGINMTPYLSNEEKLSAEYEDEEKRTWLEKEYKYLVSNRPRFKLDYEIYAWEKIYKIDHETRHMDKKRRPFELHHKPTNRTLDERKPNYIPRALRPDLPRRKGRDAKEFWP